MKRLTLVAVLVCGLFMTTCELGNNNAGIHNTKSTPASELSARPIIDWMELLYYHIANEKLSPPIASRIYGYTGVLLYEAVLPGMPGYQSYAGQVNGLEDLPRANPNEEYDWLTVMNTALYYGIDFFLERFITQEVQTLNNLHAHQIEERSAVVSAEVIERSKAYGRELARAVEAWASSDNFDKDRLKLSTYKTPSRDGHPEYWEPTDFGQTALEPFWSNIRPFVLNEPTDCGIAYGGNPGPIETTLPEFSTDPESDFYKTVLAVYEKDKVLTEEERIIALFWADDPGETSTPPGHWIYIMNNMVKSLDMKLDKAAEMYSLVGVGIADAFIAVWDTKYRVNLVRPKTYIREFMDDKGWEPYVETPPFPEYASGHSGVSGSAATLLTHLLGEKPFVDSTHIIIGLEPRKFDNFWHAAREAAESRHYGGIHYRAAIEDALEQGKCVADAVVARVKLKEE